MDKKELRKQLELSLIKSIEETLSKVNFKACAEIKKSNQKHAKDIAKKFYKAVKHLSSTPAKKIAPVKKSANKVVKKVAVKKSRARKK